ncbi:Nuclear cap-binding protein subunit 1 [Blastocladiella emersonii ATCC 22665]|nr:Nuclear cap-binding protein subunit 1 [Blastocladiella emersonii ATCC 22665]
MNAHGRPVFQRRGGNGGRGRRMVDPHVEEAQKLRSLLVMAGDKPIQAVAMINDVATVVVRDFNNHREMILTTFAGCTAELSHKPHVYAAMLSAITQQDQTVGAAVLDAVHQHLTQALIVERPAHLRSIVRFLAYAAELGVLDAGSVVAAILEPLTAALQSGVLDYRNDSYATAVLGATLFAPQTFAPFRVALLGAVGTYVQSRAADPERQALLEALRPLDPATAPFDQADYLLHLASNVAQLWTETVPSAVDGQLAGPAIAPLAAWPVAFTFPVVDQASLVVAPVELPAVADRPAMAHFDAPPPVVFRVFDDELAALPGFPADHPNAAFVPQVPKTATVERLVCVELVQDLLINIQNNHKAGARSLLDLKLLFQAGTFVLDEEEAAVVGPSQGSHAQMPEYNFEQLLIETIFAALFRLPLPQVRPVFYTDVIMGLCRVSPKRVAQALGKALHVSFGRLEATDPDCLVRLVDLFSHHLSNFGFGWKWADWAYVLQPPTLPEGADPEEEQGDVFAKRRAFVLVVLERITRLAYYDRIRGTLPEELKLAYAALEPRAGTPVYPSPEHSAFAEQIGEMVRHRVSPDELFEYCERFLNNTSTTVEGVPVDPTEATGQLRHTVLTALLAHGQKTFSHTMTVLERYLPLLRKLAPAAHAGAKAQLVASVFQFWKRHRQFFLIVVDKLLHYRVCEPGHVVAWLMETMRNGPAAASAGAGAGGDEAMAVDGSETAPAPAAAAANEEEGGDEVGPVFALEVICLTVKKALYRIDALEDKLEQVTRMDANEPEATVATIRSNLANAERERDSLFAQIAHSLLEDAVAEPAAADRTQWSSWSLGSLATLLRMYSGDIRGDVRTAVGQIIAEKAPSDHMRQTLAAALAVDRDV